MARKKGKLPPEPSTGKTSAFGGDTEIVDRRARRVNQLRADGYSLREIADALLKLHMEGDTPWFTFMASDGRTVLTPAQVQKLTRDDLRTRAYAAVKWDVAQARKAMDADKPDQTESRFLLAERYRRQYRRLIERMEGVPGSRSGEADNGKYNAMMRTAIDLAARIGRLDGIETEKPIEIRLPETYRAWIDDSGIIHKEKVGEEQKPN